MNLLRRASQFFRPDQSKLIGVVLLMILGVALNLLKPWPIAIAIDSVLGEKPLPDWFPPIDPGVSLLICMVLSLFVIHFAVAMLTAFNSESSIDIGLNGLRRVRLALFEKLQQLPLKFHLGKRQGDLIQRATWDTYSFQTLFQQVLVTGVTAGCSLLLMLVVMANLNIPLTLVALAIIPCLLLTMKRFAADMVQRSARAQEADSVLASRVQQNISAVTLIRSYNHEPAEIDEFASRADRSRTLRQSQHSREVWYLAELALVFGAGVAAILWIGSKQVMAGHITVGELIVFLAYLTQFYDPLNQITAAGSTVSAASAGANRVFEILDEPIPQLTGDKLPAADLKIEFDNTTFGFDPDKPVLKKLNLQLNPGETVALIGPSGSGKSTLLRLLLRFHDPDQGSININGNNLRQIDPREIRRETIYVEQEPILIPGTVAENIAWSNPHATKEEIEAAARDANADEFINELEFGYNTVIGEGAARLSVGESQRLALARAFLKPGRLVLLDEPTSALDASNEQAITDALAVLCQNRTTILTTHRPELLKFAQRIIVLDHGEIEADGPIEKVTQENDYLRRMFTGTA